MPGTPTPFYQLVVPTVSGDSNAWGGELNTDLGSLDAIIALPRIAWQTAGTTGAVALDLGGSSPVTTSGLFWVLAPTGAVTLSFNNAPPNVSGGANVATRLSIKVVMGATPYAVTWPGSVTWLGSGAAPLFGANTTSVVEFYSTDNGTTWLGWANTASTTGGGSKVLFMDGAKVGTSGTLDTYTVPANTLTTVGQTLWTRVMVNIAGLFAGAMPSVSITFGGVTIATISGSQNGPIWLDLETTYQAAGVQITTAHLVPSGNPPTVTAVTTLLNMTAAQVLNFTVAGGGGGLYIGLNTVRVMLLST